MGGDSLVALGRAAAAGEALFAHNTHLPVGCSQVLRLTPARSHVLGEKIRTQHLELPQARQTFRVLGSQPAGCWGYAAGVNDQGVAIGLSEHRTKLNGATPALTGPDLVRLALERARSATQAVDLIGDLIRQHGQGSAPADAEPGLLVADPNEAFVFEAAGPGWVYQQVLQVRAHSDVTSIRQDWDRISPGLSAQAIARDWWPGDGTKLDFAGSLASDPAGANSALQRWGRATLLLEEQSGHIDVPFLRRVLSDHYEGMHDEVDPLAQEEGPSPLCSHAWDEAGVATAASLVAALSRSSPAPGVVWFCFGLPCVGVYFPVLLAGDLPEAFTAAAPASAASLWWRIQRMNEELRRDPLRWALARESFSRLQAHFDQDVEEFVHEAADDSESPEQRARLATLFMQQTLERFEQAAASVLEQSLSEVLHGLEGSREPARAARPGSSW